MRAVSPVVATALLVLIAVATAVLLYLWVSGTVSNASTNNPALQESLKIEAVYNNSNKVYAYIRNTGNVPVNVTTAYLIQLDTGNVVAANTSVKTIINANDVKNVLLFNAATLKKGVTYLVKVVTKDGVEATSLFTPR